MFVFHALVLTFITTPITALIMPEKYRLRLLDSASSSQTTLGPIDPGVVDGLDGEEKGAGLNLTKPIEPEPFDIPQEATYNGPQQPVHVSGEERDQMSRRAAEATNA